MYKIINEIVKKLQRRKKKEKTSSYASSLYNKGIKKILNKIKEETTELIIVIKKVQRNKNKKKVLRYKIIKETADLWFHTLICNSYLDILHTEIVEELYKRLKVSGFEEKTNRIKNKHS